MMTQQQKKYGIAIFLFVLLIGALLIMLQSNFLRVSVVEFDETALSYSDFLEKMKARGANVSPTGAVMQPFFSVKGYIVKINNEDLQIFQYDDPETLDNDVLKVNADASSVGQTPLFWAQTPHFYKNGRLIVLYRGNDANMMTLLSTLLGSPFASRD